MYVLPYDNLNNVTFYSPGVIKDGENKQCRLLSEKQEKLERN